MRMIDADIMILEKDEIVGIEDDASKDEEDRWDDDDLDHEGYK